MPTYDYCCKTCKRPIERNVPIVRRDLQTCEVCGVPLVRRLAAPMFKRVVLTPDQVTAEVLGIPEKDLPRGLKT